MVRGERPDPDALLESLRSEEERQRQGKLKVFLGASAGVGKTFAMLSEAQEQLRRGTDVIVGLVETHKRKETEALLEGLERLPLRRIEYKSVELNEFDIDAALARRPQLILVDELAHTNIPDSRHAKRWQDIDELLREGISVYTAVNIQHLASLNDVVAQITGVQVRETVPDAFLERADEIEVVDLPPDELIQRLRDGKVYVPDRIEHALEGFFRKGNLIALRELALRRAADRVDAQMQTYRTEQGVQGLWPARERVLVCVAPNDLGARVVRAAARISSSSHAEMLAVFVESDRQDTRSVEDQDRARAALELAESLGMQTVTLKGHDIAGEVVRYAEQRNVTMIIVGKPVKSRWREKIYGSVVDEIVRRSGTIDVHVITAEAPTNQTRKPAQEFLERGHLRGYIFTVFVTAVSSAICLLLYRRLELTNLIMIYLLGVTVVASRWGPREAILASVLSVLSFDVMFVPPRGTLAVSDSQYLVTFAVMLAVSLLISTLALRLKREARLSTERERRTASLYTLSHEMARSRSKREIAEAAAKEIREVFDADVAVFLSDEPNALVPTKSGIEHAPTEAAVASWALQHNEEAGLGTDTLPGSKGYYLPLRGTASALGVLAIYPNAGQWPMPPAQHNLLETFANGLGLALERTLLAKEFHQARIQAESERMRNALLSSISHDLRTPLTSIAGAASALRDGRGDSHALSETIYHESVRLNLQVQNLLDMTRLQSGNVQPRLEWNSLEEIVGNALQRSRGLLEGRQVKVDIAEDLPLVRVDGELIEKVIANLLENAANHTPSGTSVEISAREQSAVIMLDVADHGPGIPKEQQVSIFDRFFRTDDRPSKGGFGLGLAIGRAIMRLHEGRLWVESRREGTGAVFHVEIPKLKPPEVPRG